MSALEVVLDDASSVVAPMCVGRLFRDASRAQR